MRTGAAVKFACVLCFCVTATTMWGGVVGGNTVGREFSLPEARGNPAVVKFLSGKLVLIFRNATRVPGPEDDTVVVLDRNGHEVFARNPGLDVPETRVANMYDATLGENGVLVIAMALVDTGGRAVSALMQYQVADGRLLRIVRTNPVKCRTVAADGDKVWCLGYNVESEHLGAMDYDVVYCFASSGEILRSLFPRSNLSRFPFSWRGSTESQLVGMHGEFAAWLPGSNALLRWQSGGNNPRQLSVVPPTPEDSKVDDEIVILPDGKVVGLLAMGNQGGVPLRPVRTPYILTDGGQFSRLPSWREVPTGDYLAGADGEDMVFFRRQTRSVLWLSLTNSPSKPPTPE